MLYAIVLGAAKGVGTVFGNYRILGCQQSFKIITQTIKTISSWLIRT